MVKLIIKTTKCPFHKSEIEELAYKVMPRKVRKLNKTVEIKDVKMHHVFGGQTYPQFNKLVIELNCNAKKRFIKEKPFVKTNSEYGVKLGYNRHKEYETGYDYLAWILAHEFRHIEQNHFWSTIRPIKEKDADQYAEKTQRRLRGYD